MKNDSQTTNILNFLLLGCSLTPLEALTFFGSFRLASRAHEIEQRYGIRIERKLVTDWNGKKFCQYWIPQNKVSC